MTDHILSEAYARYWGVGVYDFRDYMAHVELSNGEITHARAREEFRQISDARKKDLDRWYSVLDEWNFGDDEYEEDLEKRPR